MYSYNSKDQIKNTLDVREDYDWNDPDNEFHSTETREYVEMFAAPAKSEAIDWLDSKEVYIKLFDNCSSIILLQNEKRESNL